MKNSTKTYLACVAAVEAAGGIVGFLIKDGVKRFNATAIKPVLMPPSIAFPIAWTILYALMGIGLARILMTWKCRARTKAIIFFAVQLVLNFTWSLVFFNAMKFAVAFFILVALWLAIWLMVLSWNNLDKTAARLQIPYIVWVTFAGYLNYMITILN